MVEIGNYPGIYVKEFAPPSPIQGVGTSTLGFIGTARMGSTEPVRLFDWDSFQREFGEWSAQYPDSYLAPAVYGFFLNGGTVCYVLRASSGAHASWELKSGTGANAVTVLFVEALEEGASGNAIRFSVKRTSLLENYLTTRGQPATLPVHYAESKLTANLPTGPNADRHTIKVGVGESNLFRIGERVVFQGTAPGSQPSAFSTTVADIPDGQTVVLAENEPTTNQAFANSKLRSDDLQQGQREILVEVPAGIKLGEAVPVGTGLKLTQGAQTDVRVVQSAGDAIAGPTITLAVGLGKKFALSVAAAAAVAVSSLEWDLNVTAPVAESFPFLSMQPEHPNYWGTKVNSTQIRLVEPDPPPSSSSDDLRPNDKANSGPPTSPGRDDDPASAWLGLRDPSDELKKFAAIEDIDIVCIPGQTDATAQEKMLDWAEKTRRFAIFDAPRLGDPAAHVTSVRGTSEHAGHAALYHPWLLVRHPDPHSNRKVYWPPSGHVAGIYARTDQKGVHVAPANEPVLGAIGLAERLTDHEQDPLNKAGVNVLRVFAGTSQPMVWGARTTTDPDRNRAWQYVSTRRLFLYLEKSIERGIRSAIFAPNNPELWAQLKRTIGDFLIKTFNDGALGGFTPKDSFYVRIDEGLNPESERILGRLYMEIGVRPAYPAEFIVMRIGIWDGGSSVQES